VSAPGQFDLFGASAGVGSAAPAAEHEALRARVPARIRLGTSSWSFPGWAGIVYDRPHSEQALARHGLAAYARHPLLRAVSIDRTYYAPIDATTFASYADAVPDDFRFLVKGDRLLSDPEAESSVGPRFLDPEHAAIAVVQPAVKGLGDKLGAIVFQFSPRTAASHGGRDRFASMLREFLEALPRGPVYAVELRTPALMTEAYARTLEVTGVAHCYTVHSSMLSLRAQLARIPARANPMLVIRWMLREGMDYEGARETYAPFNRLVAEDPATRNEIARVSLNCARDDRDVIICINNKAEGSAPLSAFRLAEAIAESAKD
jgi:uncharacterized protein YecE (DUF72 family)